MKAQSIQEMIENSWAQPGKVAHISIRPERKAPVQSCESVEAVAGHGLKGDHYGSKGGKRQVTLIQGEHLDAVASMLGKDHLEPGITRRNIIVKGINLLALKDRKFRIGDAILEYTGLCHPCSNMEDQLGQGGYNAMRGHGGITARVLESGPIKLGDEVSIA